jgi:hypothetical protein
MQGPCPERHIDNAAVAVLGLGSGIEVSGQLHAQAAFLKGKSPGAPLIEGWLSPTAPARTRTSAFQPRSQLLT